MKSLLGLTVLYTLTSQDAEQINRRRTNPNSIADRIEQDKWPMGAQAHIGNRVYADETYPATVVRQWGPDTVNLKVHLDGTDFYWAPSIINGDDRGEWKFPEWAAEGFDAVNGI